MHSLRSLQSCFAKAVFDPENTAFGLRIRPDGLGSADRLRIYRNNVFASLTEALRACYPVVDRLVGKQFFDFAAHRYIRRYPSASGDLHDFGASFDELLERLPEAASLVYLADVARLEWAYQEVFHAADADPLDLTAIASIPQERYAGLRFRLHAASRLLASAYPVLRIWQVNQPEHRGDDTVDLSAGGIKLLVIRRALEIELEPLSAGEYALLTALAQGRTMDYACEHALAAEPDLDLPATLRSHVRRHTLVGFSS